MKQRLFITAITASLLLTGCGQAEGSNTDEASYEATGAAAYISEETETAAESSEKNAAAGTETISESTEEPQTDDDKTVSGSAEMTISAIMKANSNENVLSLFDSVRTEVVSGEKACVIYADGEFRCLCYPEYADGQIGDRVCTLSRNGFETELAEDKSAINLYEQVFFLDGAFDDLRITGIREEGECSVVTAAVTEKSSESLLNLLDLEDSDYSRLTAEITLHSDNLIIDKVALYALSASGPEEIMTMSCSYNEGKDEIMQKLYDHMNTTDLRTITMIVNPGEDDEYTLSTQGVRGDEIRLVSYSGITCISEYEDRECTHGYNTGSDKDKSADFVFYAKEWPSLS